MKTQNTFLAIVTALTFSTRADDVTFDARVIAVHDGDTITVERENKKRATIRLAVIDAPELAQPHGTASAKSLTRELLGTTVTVRVANADKYGRAVAFLSRGKIAVNLEQVKNGNAWFYNLYSQTLQNGERKQFLEAEQFARKTKNGLWALPSPLEPWIFRHQHSRR